MSYYVEYRGIVMPIDQAVKLKNQGKVQVNELMTLTESKKEAEIAEPEAVEATKEAEIAEKPLMTAEEMKIKLTEAGVSYHHASGLPKLTELMKENNLI